MANTEIVPPFSLLGLKYVDSGEWALGEPVASRRLEPQIKGVTIHEGEHPTHLVFCPHPDQPYEGFFDEGHQVMALAHLRVVFKILS